MSHSLFQDSTFAIVLRDSSPLIAQNSFANNTTNLKKYGECEPILRGNKPPLKDDP
jgi:hypothetical protein